MKTLEDLEKTNTLTKGELRCNHQDEDNDSSDRPHQTDKKSGGEEKSS